MRRHSKKKNSHKIFVAVTVAAAIVFGATYYFINKKDDVVVAKINDQKIFKSEIENKLREVFDGKNIQSAEVTVPEIATLPREVIELLVKEIYLEKELTAEAKKSKVAQTQEIKDKIADAKNKILRQAYVSSLLKEEISEQKVSDKYAELSAGLAGKKEFSVFHIVVQNKAEAEKLIKELKGKKASEKLFAELAKKYSIDQESAANGGDLGYVLEDNMIKEISDVVLKLKKDEISEPVQTKFGWHVIKVADIRDAKPLPFEAVKENIREQLSQDKLNEINSKFTKDAKIKILIDLKEAEAPKEAQENSEAPKAEGETNAAVDPAATPEQAAPTAENPTTENKELNTNDEKTEATKSSEKSHSKAAHKKHKH